MKDRFDKFTEGAREVLRLAQIEAQHLGHSYLGSEHILLGILREGDSLTARVLKGLGVELQTARAAVEKIIGRGESVHAGEVGLTARAKQVIELAVDEARKLNHHYVGTEHLLLGLLREGQGAAAQVLESLGVRLEQVRASILEAHGTIIGQTEGTGGPNELNVADMEVVTAQEILDDTEVVDREPTDDELARTAAALNADPFEDRYMEKDIDRILTIDGVSPDDQVRVYVREISRKPPLTPEAESELVERISLAHDASQELLRQERVSQEGNEARDYTEGRQQLELVIADGERARQQFVQANLGMVVGIARGFVGSGLSLLDLIKQGSTGLMQAAERFDHARGYSFDTYAVWWIYQALARAVINQSRSQRLPVHIIEMVTRVRRVSHDLQQKLQREPTDAELGAELGMSAERVHRILDMAHNLASLDAQMDKGRG